MNIDESMVSFLSDVVGVVEATSYEQLTLWREYQWNDRSEGGPLITVGHLAKMPVCITLMKANVKGHTVAFMDITSQVVDHRLIDEWLSKHMPKEARRVNAMNFHNVFPQPQVESSRI